MAWHDAHSGDAHEQQRVRRWEKHGAASVAQEVAQTLAKCRELRRDEAIQGPHLLLRIGVRSIKNWRQFVRIIQTNLLESACDFVLETVVAERPLLTLAEPMSPYLISRRERLLDSSAQVAAAAGSRARHRKADNSKGADDEYNRYY